MGRNWSTSSSLGKTKSNWELVLVSVHWKMEATFNEGPYSLVDTEVMGCMRTCNIVNMRQMLGYRIDIHFYHFPLLLIPFCLPMTLYLALVSGFLWDFDLECFPFPINTRNSQGYFYLVWISLLTLTHKGYHKQISRINVL